MTEIIGYCPNEENAQRKFVRTDNRIPLIGRYRCLTCEEIYLETSLQRGEENKDLADLIKEKLGKK